MRRRTFASAVLACAVVSPLPSLAQTNRPRRVAALMATRADALNRQRLDPFLHGLRQLGWEEGRNITIEVHWGDGDAMRITALVQQLVSQQPDIILANGATVLAHLHAATSTLPVVFANTADPVEAGIVQSLARPGGNITGFTNFEQAMSPKWLEILKEIAPATARVVMLHNPENFAWRHALPLLRSVAPGLGIELIEAPVKGASEIRHILAAQSTRSDTGLLAYPEATTNSHRELIVGQANALRLPAIYAYREFCQIGGLISYGVDVLDIFRRSASYVDRILRGAAPADLPIQAPTNFQLVINLKTARALGIEVPPMLLARADEVIE